MLIHKNLSLTFFPPFTSVLDLLVVVFLNQRNKTIHFKTVVLKLSTIPMICGLWIQTELPTFVSTLFWNYLFTLNPKGCACFPVIRKGTQ